MKKDCDFCGINRFSRKTIPCSNVDCKVTLSLQGERNYDKNIESNIGIVIYSHIDALAFTYIKYCPFCGKKIKNRKIDDIFKRNKK